MSDKPRSALGQALVLHQEAVDHCEALYLQHAGEVTDEVEEAEARRDFAGQEALQALARYRRYLDGRDRDVAAERESLDRFEADTARRRAWADERIADMVETLAPGRSRLTAGTATIKIRRTTAVETGPGFELGQCPPAWRRTVPEKVTPASEALDKKAAAADLKQGYRDGEPPSSGWYEVEGQGRRYLARGREAWRLSFGPEYPGDTLDAQGLSLVPEPGRDLLRWRPSPPGVSLVKRRHVTVE